MSPFSPGARVSELDFDNTEIAFQSRSTLELYKALWLFRSFNTPLVTIGPKLLTAALKVHAPVSPIVKATVFRHFCGGETIEECEPTVKQLAQFNIGSILDYSVEGRAREQDFADTLAETLRTIKHAADNRKIPFTVFKVTGLARPSLLAKLDAGLDLSKGEQKEWSAARARVAELCQAADEAGVRILIDAEESWIQDTIDGLALDMMRKHNRRRPVVYNTLQMYRHDRLAYLKASHRTAKSEGFLLGVKLVRGAYMEKERARAAERGEPSPIQPNKAATDRDFDAAVLYALEHLDDVAIFVGTHNESSTKLLADLVCKKGLAPGDERIAFSQLYGMSDHLTYNLAFHGFNASKYLPYGPVRAVLPYLFRRAEENSSIKGQAGRELQLISRELQRRRAAK